MFQCALIMALAGCSVKEDRSSCPCTVMIDFTQMDAVRHSAADVLAVTDGTPVLYETVPSERYGEQYSFRVKRVSTVVDISSGWPERNGAETGFTVTHYGLNDIISRVQNGMTVTSETFPAVDMFRMEVKSGEEVTELYFCVNAEIVGITIDHDSIIF